MQFFLLTFLFSWSLWLPGMLVTFDLVNTSPAFTNINNILKWVGGIGPSLVAIYLVIKFDGKEGAKKLFRRILQVKPGY